MMKRFTIISLILALLAGSVACTQKEEPVGEVVISFSTGAAVTRAGEVGNGNALDGGGIVVSAGVPDLFIAIANYSGTVVAWYPNTTIPANAELVEAATATDVSVRFKGINTSGEYTVYAVANLAGNSWGLPSSAAAWNAITTASDLDAITFTALTGSNLLTLSDRMPISAKGTLNINEGLNGHADLEMLRCVGKVGFRFKNETGSALSLEDCVVSIEEINPTQGYLFPRENDATGTARNLTLIDDDLSLAIGETTDLYGLQLVFPSIAPTRPIGSRYYCNISFTVGSTPYTFEDLPIHDKLSQDILALGRNQYLKIETRINQGYRISFNFEVIDWTQNQEDIIFH